MKIKLEFGLQNGTETVNWFRSIEDFPKYMRYQGSVYEFVMYEKRDFDFVDYVFQLSETRFHNMKWEDIPMFKDMFGNYEWSTCFCGAKYDKDNPNYHFSWCPKWKSKKD